MPSPWEFKDCGRGGLAVTSLFPHLDAVAEELCLIRSMTVKFREHAQASDYFPRGHPRAGYPSPGGWASYGLGTENENLPAVHQGQFLYPERKEPLRDITPENADALQRRLSLDRRS